MLSDFAFVAEDLVTAIWEQCGFGTPTFDMMTYQQAMDQVCLAPCGHLTPADVGHWLVWFRQAGSPLRHEASRRDFTLPGIELGRMEPKSIALHTHYFSLQDVLNGAGTSVLAFKADNCKVSNIYC